MIHIRVSIRFALICFALGIPVYGSPNVSYGGDRRWYRVHRPEFYETYNYKIRIG